MSDTRDWLVKALHDLTAAERLIETDPPLTDVATFHCQQGAEKALKAFLFWHDVPFRKTHELEELGGACVEIDRSLAEVVQAATPLTPFAWRFRYPGDLSEPTVEEARDALRQARDVYDAVLAHLPDETSPQ